MAGKGKYTTYNAPNSTRKSFLERMFKGDGDNENPFSKLDHAEGTKVASSYGNVFLRATVATNEGAIAEQIQRGDIGFFPDGVDISYQGKTSKISAPDKVKGTDGIGIWGEKFPGMSANPYMPDISSPGPGKTEGTDKSVDPHLTVAEFNAIAKDDPNGLAVAERLPGLTQNLVNPTDAGQKLYDVNAFGLGAPVGKSGI